MADFEPLMTLKEACQRFFNDAIMPATLRAEAARGRLSLVRIGRRDFVTESDLREMIEQCRVPRTPIEEQDRPRRTVADEERGRQSVAAVQRMARELTQRRPNGMSAQEALQIKLEKMMAASRKTKRAHKDEGSSAPAVRRRKPKVSE